jgi:hypothetical protein
VPGCAEKGSAQRLFPFRHDPEGIHCLDFRRRCSFPAHAEEHNLPELLVFLVREAVDAHADKVGEHVPGRVAELEQMLRHDPDEQAARLQPRAAAPEPLVFQPAVLVVTVVGRVEVEEVVAVAGGNQALVGIVQNMGNVIFPVPVSPSQHRVHSSPRRLRPALVQLDAIWLEAEHTGQCHQSGTFAGAGVEDATAVRRGDVRQNEFRY